LPYSNHATVRTTPNKKKNSARTGARRPGGRAVGRGLLGVLAADEFISGFSFYCFNLQTL